MGLFGLGRKKEPKGVFAARREPAEAPAPDDGGVKVLGSGCAKCNALDKAVREAIAELGADVQVEHVTDFAMIAAYGVMSTPALVAGGRVLSFGRVLTKDEAKELLAGALA